MPIALRRSCPHRIPEHDRDLIWLSQVLSPPSSYGVTPTPPARDRPRDCLPEAVDAQLAQASTRHEIRCAWTATEGAGHA